MAHKKSTWLEKLNKPHEPKIIEVPERMKKMVGDGTMFIATPLMVDSLIKKIPKRKLSTINHMRNKLAFDNNTDTTCPITTGIFTWIAAFAAEEIFLSGKRKITPYWRIVKDDGSLNPKYPDGENKHAKHLMEEGFEIIPSKKSKHLKVKNPEKFFYNFM